MRQSGSVITRRIYAHGRSSDTRLAPDLPFVRLGALAVPVSLVAEMTVSRCAHPPAYASRQGRCLLGLDRDKPRNDWTAPSPHASTYKSQKWRDPAPERDPLLFHNNGKHPSRYFATRTVRGWARQTLASRLLSHSIEEYSPRMPRPRSKQASPIVAHRPSAQMTASCCGHHFFAHV